MRRLVACVVAALLLTACDDRGATPTTPNSGETVVAAPAAPSPKPSGWLTTADDVPIHADGVRAVLRITSGGRVSTAQPLVEVTFDGHTWQPMPEDWYTWITLSYTFTANTANWHVAWDITPGGMKMVQGVTVTRDGGKAVFEAAQQGGKFFADGSAGSGDGSPHLYFMLANA